MTDYRWRDGTPVAAACFENEPGPPGLLALSAADLAAFDAETAALALAAVEIREEERRGLC